jgi:hypothetical protein
MKNLNTTLLRAIWILLVCCSAVTTVKAQLPSVFGPETFTRHSGAPQTISRSFGIQDPTREYTLIIQNGDGGTERVNSAIITLNGINVAEQNEFNQNTARIIRPVTLNQTNTFVEETLARGSARSDFQLDDSIPVNSTHKRRQET